MVLFLLFFADLSLEYRTAMDAVRAWVDSQLGGGSGGRGVYLRRGAQLADQISSLAAALNEREIPSAGSVIEGFNREAYARTISKLRTSLAGLDLPLDKGEFGRAAETLVAQGRQALTKLLFGDASAIVASYGEAAAFEVRQVPTHTHTLTPCPNTTLLTCPL